MNLKYYVNNQKKELNESISIKKNINNNSFYLTINKIDDDQKEIKVICEKHDIFKMINHDINDDIILHKKYKQKKNKKISIDKNKDNSEKHEFNNENFENTNKYNNNNNP